MTEALEILQTYWKHNAFRSPQEEIIKSVLDGKDTFVLLPTGGGKSICFQVPAMMREGICLVISPLVALMNDQIQNLAKRNIKAIALTGGKSSDEISNLLDNCQYGNYKFLYLSPERLQNDWVFERLRNLPINSIAIDEAHCVSQWGHDFRPAYLKISKLKTHFNKIPFIALTASATKRVQEDIINQLNLDNPCFFKKSFLRENIAYMVLEIEDKLYLLEKILRKNQQSSIIYVRNRKSCIEISNKLESFGFKSTYYHGGLTSREKEKNMQFWMEEKAQIMVATNAFGMGIDKEDVKTVIHLHLPENLENYYQEAGRAGRNGKNSFAIILTNPSDIIHAESQFLSVLPDKSFLNLIFKKLCNFLQIAYGEGINNQYNFNLSQFCLKYNLPTTKTFNALQFLDRQAIISFSQQFSEKFSIQFIIPSKEVIRYNSLNPNDEDIILTILRTYPGIYETITEINIQYLIKKTKHSEETIVKLLEKLHTRGIIDLTKKNNDTTITFNEIREDERTINRVAKYLIAQNNLKKEQFSSVLNYIKNKSKCKSTLILEYFGETESYDCGKCSYCISKKKEAIDIKTIKEQIITLLENQSLNSREILNSINIDKEDVIFALKDLLEDGTIIINPNNLYSLKNQWKN